MKTQYGHIEDAGEMMEKVTAELNKLISEYKSKMESPGVVPFSEEVLPINDNDGNTIFSIVCMKDQSSDYVKVLKKNGFPAQVFDCDP